MQLFRRPISWLLLTPILLAFLLFILANNQPSAVLSVAEPTPLTSAQQPPLNPVSFVESALAKGISFEHQRRSHGLNSIADSYGNGLCVIDYDQDGFEDLFVVAGQGATRRYGKDHWWNNDQNSVLYKNINGQYFTPVSLFENSQKNTALSGFGCTVGDINNDGLNDIIVGDTGTLHLLLNQQPGDNPLKQSPFSYQQQPLPNPYDWPTALLVNDINQDGIFDLLVATLVEYRNDLKVGNQEYGYQARTTIATSDYTGQNNLVLLGVANDEGVVSQRPTFKAQILAGQQRTMSMLPLSLLEPNRKNSGSVLMVNANGSNTVLQTIKGNTLAKSPLSWLTFPATQITPITVANKPYYLIANHVAGAAGIQLVNLQNRVNEAWNKNLTNNVIDSAQTWATLSADFNNDGLTDVALSSGSATPGLNSPSRPQGSANQLMFQRQDGQFVPYRGEYPHGLNPPLVRSSRGAVYGDFNNDGFIDMAFLNNNNFASLYLNQTNRHHWINFSCTPIKKCQHSQWILTFADGEVSRKSYQAAQPYLSKNSERISFGLGQNSAKVKLSVRVDNEQVVHHFDGLATDSLYRVDLANNHIAAMPTAVRHKVKKITAEAVFHGIFDGRDNGQTPSQLLAFLTKPTGAEFTRAELTGAESGAKLGGAEDLIELLTLVNTYKRGLGQKISSQDHRFAIILAWVINQSEMNPQLASNQALKRAIFDLSTAIENRLFVDHIKVTMKGLDTPSFCRLSHQLAYWFEEEEVLPETKLDLLAGLLQQGLTHANHIERFSCAIEAASHSEQTTIGASLLGYLDHQQPIRTAAVIRALGRFKYSKAQAQLSQFCQQSDDPLIAFECAVSQVKLQGNLADIKMKAAAKASFFALHSQRLLLKERFAADDDETMSLSAIAQQISNNHYERSMIKDHRYLAYQALLLQGQFAALSTLLDREHVGLSGANEARDQDFVRFIEQVRRLYPSQTDNLIEFLFDSDELVVAKLMPYASNTLLRHFIEHFVGHATQRIHRDQVASALVKQCVLRRTLAKHCQSHFASEQKLINLSFDKLMAMPPSQFYYLLYTANKTQGRVIVRRLYQGSKQDKQHHEIKAQVFARLHHNQLYTLLTQADAAWLNRFLAHSFKTQQTVAKLWLRQLSLDDFVQQDKPKWPWLTLYQKHSKIAKVNNQRHNNNSRSR